MSAQVLGRHGDPNRLGHLREDAAIGRSVGERPMLAAEISALRRRIVAARDELASVQDPVLCRVRTAQRALADERHEMDCVIEAIGSETDAQVGLIRGFSGFSGGPSVMSGHNRVGAERDQVALHEADAGWLRSECGRLSLKAELLERQVHLATPSRATAVGARDLALLEAMLVGALAVTREDHSRIRERAEREADGRSAAAREQADQISVNGPSGPSLTPGAARSAHSPAPSWADGRVATFEVPNLGVPLDEPQAVRSRELSLRPPDDPRDRATGSSEVRRPNPTDRPMSKPLLLDIVLPLIAVAIVLLVVLSWIG